MRDQASKPPEDEGGVKATALQGGCAAGTTAIGQENPDFATYLGNTTLGTSERPGTKSQSEIRQRISRTGGLSGRYLSLPASVLENDWRQ
jgi:hypothetical protein